MISIEQLLLHLCIISKASFVLLYIARYLCVIRSALYKYEPRNMAASAESRRSTHLSGHIFVLETSVLFYSLHIAM